MFGIFKNLFSQSAPTNLQSILADGALLVDVRNPFEYQMGTVKGAINIPLQQVEQQLSKFKNQKAIVVFCQSGNRSGQAKQVLDQHGIPNVYNGGSWKNVQNQL